jgi:hypothetical protein
MPLVNLRRLALGALAAAALVPAQAQASTAELPHLKVPNRSVEEEGTAAVKFRLGRCEFSECSYRFTAQSGTATAIKGQPGALDYNPFAVLTWALKRDERKTLVFRVKTLDDRTCEPNEYFTINAESTFAVNDPYGGDGSHTDSGRVTIRDNDCPTKSQATEVESGKFGSYLPQPATPPTGPGDARGSSQTVTRQGNATLARCSPEFAEGVAGQNGAWGHYIAGCTAALQCPETTEVCGVRTESRINLERYTDTRVTLTSRLRAFRAGIEFFKRDTKCDILNWCATEDAVNVRGGEVASVQCSGVRTSTAQPNRARVSCQLSMVLNPLP